jgi:RNA polymerase sigma factor for flagellar operon FliA
MVEGYEAEGESRAAYVRGVEEPRSTEETQGLHLVGSERDKLLVEHLPTVRYIARKVHERLPQHVEMEDLVSAGTMGLIDAFNKFDHSRHVQFNSYAQFRIKGAILDHLRELDWGPRELRRKGRAIEEATQALTKQLGRSPLEQEIAEQMGMKLSAYQHLVGDLKSLEVSSLHAIHNEASGEEEMAFLAGPEQDSPLLAVMQGEMKQLLMDAIEELPEKERLVLTLSYYEELSMKEIGEVLGVVESRVSQIRSAGIARLRAAMGVTPELGPSSSQRKPPARTYVGKQRLMA